MKAMALALIRHPSDSQVQPSPSIPSHSKNLPHTHLRRQWVEAVVLDGNRILSRSNLPTRIRTELEKETGGEQSHSTESKQRGTGAYPLRVDAARTAAFDRGAGLPHAPFNVTNGRFKRDARCRLKFKSGHFRRYLTPFSGPKMDAEKGCQTGQMI